MRNLIQLYARHNAESNRVMLGLIEAHFSDPWVYPLSGYHFRTLGSLLDHLWVTDNNWMAHVLGATSQAIDLGRTLAVLDHTKDHFSDYPTFRTARDTMDCLIQEYSERLEEGHLVEDVGSGPLGDAVSWKPLVHLFHHQAHHRGQVSALLDSLGIENDLPGILRL